MPAYNLPDFPAIPQRTTRPRPPPLALANASPKAITPFDRAGATSPPVPPTAPALTRQSFTGGWGHKRNYSRSPLSPSPRLEQWDSAKGLPLSRRYLRPPPMTSAVLLQTFTTPLMGRDERGFKMYEEMVWKTLERRLREKVLRGRSGERAGLGAAAGREMILWASLGSYRVAREQTALTTTASMSAPSDRLTFVFPRNPRAEDARRARSLGHRKSQSTTSMTLAATGDPLSRTSPTSALGKIRGFVSRRVPPGSGLAASEPRFKDSLIAEAAAMRRIVQDYTEDIKSEFDMDDSDEESSEDEDAAVTVQQVAPPLPGPAIDISLDHSRPLPPSRPPLPYRARTKVVTLPTLSTRTPSASPPRSPPRPSLQRRSATLPTKLNLEISLPLLQPRPPPAPKLPQSPAPAFLRRTSSSSSLSSIEVPQTVASYSAPSSPAPRELYSPSSSPNPIVVSLPPPRYLTGRCVLPRVAMPVALPSVAPSLTARAREKREWMGEGIGLPAQSPSSRRTLGEVG